MSTRATKNDRAAVPEGPYDLVVVGGGINGAAIARDAVLRGKSVALFDKGDFASGTSSASSKMVHGGIRYLEHLRLGLVHEALRERTLLLQLAPHLVRPQSFVLPVYSGGGRGPLWIRLGLWLYDCLSVGRRLGKSRYMKPNEVSRAVPGILEEGLHGGGLYFDAVMDDARLCLANVLSARAEASRPGSFVARNYTRVETREGSAASAPIRLEIEDETCGRRQTILARRVVRALGPWSDPELLVRSKGVHLVVRRIPGDHGLLLQHSRDGRVFFVIPWKEFTVIGTTETPFDASPDDLRVEPEEVAYLLGEIRRLVPGHPLRPEDVLGAFAGVRPLARAGGLLSRLRGAGVGATSRKQRIFDDGAGTLTVVGGKFTTYRAVAEEVVNRLFPGTRCATRTRPLHGGQASSWEEHRATLAPGVLRQHRDEDLARLWRRYGTALDDVLRLTGSNRQLAEPILAGVDIWQAEVVHGVQEEHVVHPEDFLDRRSPARYSPAPADLLYDGVARLIDGSRGYDVGDSRQRRAAWLARHAARTPLDDAVSATS